MERKMLLRKTSRIHCEPLNPDFGFYYTVEKSLHRAVSPHQKIELVDTAEFGTVLQLDNITQVAEREEFQYHEPMVHPALCAHPAPRNILVIGGGDGGVLREVLRYPGVERVDFAELDERVVRFCSRYMDSINKGAFRDKRVQTTFGDGRKFVEQNPGSFDVVIMDMTDPFGPSRMLYTKEFFRSVKRSFRNRYGIFVMHSESPAVRPDAFACVQKTLRSTFAVTNTLYMYIKMYATLWSVAVCSDTINIANSTPQSIDKKLAKNKITGLQLYNGATHRAMQVSYPYIDEIIRSSGRIITDRTADFDDNLHLARRERQIKMTPACAVAQAPSRGKKVPRDI